MILRRLGNKSKIASAIYKHFPPHKIYIEPFFGAGGMFFNKPQAKYNIVNDLDSDVVNLFKVIKDNFDDFLFLFEITPMSEELFYYWVENKETDPVKKALRFLFLSSFSYLGKNGTFMLIHSNCTYKEKIRKLIKKTAESFGSTMIRNKDFRLFFNDIYETEAHIPKRHRFIYADPPYLGTTNNYSDSFTADDANDLFKILIESGIKFGYSEFDNPIILDLAKKYDLKIIQIGERRTLGSRNNEILVVNYENPELTLFS